MHLHGARMCSLRHLVLVSLLLSWQRAGAEPLPGPDLDSRPGATAWPAPPFTAWVAVGTLNVRLAPDAASPEVGLLNYGDPIKVIRCVPDCARPSAWAMLDGLGAVRLSMLRALPEEDRAAALASTARFVYGRVRWRGGIAYAHPDLAATRVGHAVKAGHDLAFRVDEALLARGWLRRPSGEYMPLAGIKLHHASPFAGLHDPPPAVAFTLRATTVRPDDPGAATVDVARHESLAALGLAQGQRLRVPGGTVARAAVRIATRRPRPAGVPADARWVHVDLSEQTLTAYEGDALVFATLISTGKPGFETPPGTYHVWHKSIHSAMHGDEPDRYFVDEVPFVLYIVKGTALHGTFWHDRFGERSSHGCINLSLADASWPFEWAPPPLPEGWHAIEPAGANLASLWVVVERSARLALPPHTTVSQR